ncbi:DUF6444 domain-containing protein [Planotetraspora thailandica]|uniref:DUF6444 domain-containing protein n=1 Tax=Planotetraspora thailandica TaxID=487172 RepID=UPI0035715487
MGSDGGTADGGRVGAATGRNSGNSSLPPSSDTFSRSEKQAAKNSGCKRGRQRGAGLAMVAVPDAVEDHLCRL